MAKKKAKKEKFEKSEDIIGSESKHEGLGFLEEALKKSRDSSKTLEGFMLSKTESKEIPIDESENIEITPHLTSEIKRENSKDSHVKIEVLGELEDVKDIIKPITKEINIYENVGEFFKQLFQSFGNRYARWEDSIGLILSILRKMRKITKKNTEQLITTIENLHLKTKSGLEDFEIKRDEIEKISDMNFKNISKNFKKILDLLELQIQEYQLKKEVSELFAKPSKNI